MKARITLQSLALLLMLAGCQSTSSEAEKTTRQIQEIMKANAPAAEIPSENGIYLKATIDGKSWQAEKMIPDMDPNSDCKRIHGEKGETIIAFQLWKPKTGKKKAFKEGNLAEFYTEGGIYTGQNGEVNVIKSDDQFIEGTFYFTATTTDNNTKHEITNGSFRVAATPGAKYNK